MDNIPPEIILKILCELQTEPDILLNITPCVSPLFKRLSYDSSLWKTFRVPGHWHLKRVTRFFQHHPVASIIQELICCKHVFDAIKDLPVALTNVKKFSVMKEDEEYCDYCPMSSYMYSYENHIPTLLPNLQFLEVPGDLGHAGCGRECLAKLTKALPQLEVGYSGLIWYIKTLLCPAVNKERLIVSTKTFGEVVRNAEQYVQPNTAISFYKDNLDYSALRNVTIGQAMLELTIEPHISLTEVEIISDTCSKLAFLNLLSCQSSDSPSSLKTMVHLEDMRLRMFTMPSDDAMAIVEASPSLRKLSIWTYNNISAPASCSLPRSLRSLSLSANNYNTQVPHCEFLHSLVQGSQQCTKLAYIKLQPVSLFRHGTHKVWPQLAEAYLLGPELPKLLSEFVNEHAPITKLELYAASCSIEDMPAIGCFSYLRELKFRSSCSSCEESFPTKSIELLSTKCPVLESLSIVMFDKKTDKEQKDETKPTLASMMPFLTALNSFEYLKWFSMLMDETYRQRCWIPEDDCDGRAHVLDEAFKPWRRHSALRDMLRFKQCPPAYRF